MPYDFAISPYVLKFCLDELPLK